jgi:MFS family permease
VSDANDRAFNRLLVAMGVSNLGDGVQLTALPLLAATITRDPRLIALVGVAGTVPWLVFGLLAGGIVDRVDHRRLLIRVDIVRAAIVGALVAAVVTGWTPLWLLFLLSLLLGVGETLFDTGASAYLPSVIEPGRLPLANGRLQAVRLVGNELAGPAIGGLLFAAMASSPFGLNAVSFAISAVVLGRLKRGSGVHTRVVQAETRVTTLWAEIADGMRFLLRHRSLRALAIIVVVWNLFGSLSDGVFVLYAQDVLGLGSRGYGFMIGGIAIGATLSSLLASRVIERFGQGAVLHLAISSAGVLTLLVSLTTRVALAVPWFFLMALTGYAWNVVSSSLRQTLIPTEYLGRVISAYLVIGVGTTPIGMLAGGALAKWLGYRPLFAVSGAALTITAIAAWRPLSHIVSHAEANLVHGER